MKRLRLIITISVVLLGSNLLQAQSFNDVSLLEIDKDGKNAVFSVYATATKSGNVSGEAIHKLFVTLLDQGVEGIRDGRKLEQKANLKWRENFLKSKNPPYMAYVKGYQTEGEPIKSSLGEYQATVLVKVNVEFLIRQLKAYGIISQ